MPSKEWLTAFFLLLFALASGAWSEEPALPMGLGSSSETEASKTPSKDWKEKLPFELNGFLEGRYGQRLHDDPHQKDTSVGEARLQLAAEKNWSQASINVTADFVYDYVEEDHSIDLDNGRGWIDLREANLFVRPADLVDLKIGRQILTWGTGDLVFINDLFPKDWHSFFVGRDEEYLKAPSDAVKLSLFNKLANLDVVYTPQFDSDRYIDGRRISYYDAQTDSIVGRNKLVQVQKPDDGLRDNEVSMRMYRLFGPMESALYFYDGFWKGPNGFDPLSSLYTFPPLSVYGGSVRGPLAGGIAHSEVGVYDSRDDRDGDNPLVRNSEFRFLLGYEREFVRDFTAGLQYYMEIVDEADDRDLITLRLTQFLMNQNLLLSLFNYYGPAEKDGYIRPVVSYKMTDNWQVETGGNIFFGDTYRTFFGQFEDASNLYLAARFSF